ncbi:MAG: DUF3429 domain-containing protein [bacterium]|nr:DUF3429 domain-containing protein [bacterium]
MGDMINPSLSTPRSAIVLGYCGLLPQAIAVIILLIGDPSLYWTALATAYGYAAFIFCFLGGVWWGVGISLPTPPRWIFLAAITPSLIALATYIPWIIGWNWPRPSLVALSIALALSPVVDQRILRARSGFEDWLRLRRHLSFGLGGLTMLAAWL